MRIWLKFTDCEKSTKFLIECELFGRIFILVCRSKFKKKISKKFEVENLIYCERIFLQQKKRFL